MIKLSKEYDPKLTYPIRLPLSGKIVELSPSQYNDPKVLVSQAALLLVLNALRRDAAEGRGEMADLLEASIP
jgi:hypothetical protein